MDLAQGLVTALRMAVDHLTRFPPAHPPEPAPFAHT